MALTVTVKDDTFPDDHVFEIVGLGAFVNGEATEVPEDAEQRFVSFHQKPVEDVIGQSDVVSVSGTTAIENMDDVLGVDISDTPAPPDLEAITAAHEEEAAAAEDAGQPGDATATPDTVTLPDSVTGATTNDGGDT